MRYLYLYLLFTSTALFSEEDSPPTKEQVIYLAQSNPKEAIALYQTYAKSLQRHDPNVLEKIATAILEQSARSQDPKKQVLGLYAFSIAGLSAPPDLLQTAIASPDVQSQLVALQLLASSQEDESDLLLNRAMSSEFLYTRLEAAFILAQKKAKTSTGQIESLMYRFPPPMRYFFPEFFAIIGTTESIHILRHLMDDSFHLTRIEAILSAARHGRDDLLPAIRAASTHLNSAEQEACASALGYLKDMKAIKKLKKLSTHASSNVQLAAWQSLFLLGDTSFAEKIAQEALNENLFAIALLASKPGYEDLLLKLCKSSNLSVRFNAAYALLQRKDPRVLPFLPEFLVRDSRDLGFLPAISVGNSLRAWKVISSTLQHAENSHFDLHALTLALKEQLLAGAIELEESSFLHLAKAILVAKQNELIPMLAQLLENLQTPSAIALLKQGSELPGAPLIRTYCHLTLYRLNQEGPHKQAVLEFLQKSESHELIRFRNTLPLNVRLSESTYHLTPEESSTLLIRAYQTLSEKQNIESIDILLDAISHSTLHNRPVLAAILLRTLH